MSHQNPDAHMISASYDIEDFMKAIEKKDYLDIISLANREATAAGRAIHSQRTSAASSTELPVQYERVLKELISFLRAAVTYRPSKVDK